MRAGAGWLSRSRKRKQKKTRNNMSALVLITPPATEPLTNAEAMVHLRGDSQIEIPKNENLIKAARETAERITRRALITQTWELYLDTFPAWEIGVPKPTLQSIISIVYTDTDGILQTLPGSMYLVDEKSEPGRITPAFGEVWPVTRAQTNAVIVRFVAGYGDADDVPAGFNHWLSLRKGRLSFFRYVTVIGTSG